MGVEEMSGECNEGELAKVDEIETQVVDAKTRMREMKLAAKAEKTRLKAEAKEAKRQAKLSSTPPAKLALMIAQLEAKIEKEEIDYKSDLLDLQTEHENDMKDMAAELAELQGYASK